MSKKILIVDDDDDILYILKYSLEKEGFLVSTSNNGKKGLEKALNKYYDLIILDIMMPDMTGTEICEKLRDNHRTKNTLIVFLTAKSDDISIIQGLDVGSDDYLVKPIKIDIFIKKINSILRRIDKNIDIKQTFIEIDDEIALDTKKNWIINKKTQEKIHTLTKKEYEILNLLISDKDKVFSREEIYEKIWGDNFVLDGTLDVHIKKLRDKLNYKYIHTKKGFGYIFKHE